MRLPFSILPSSRPRREPRATRTVRRPYLIETLEDRAMLDADLRAVVLSAPATVRPGVGDQMEISWTVANDGPDAASTPWWDVFYFSDDDALSADDTPTGYAYNNTPLASGASYSKTQSFEILDAWPTAAYLLVATDYYQEQSDPDRGNNVASAAVTLDNTPVDVDLFVQFGGAPTQRAGQLNLFTWAIGNNGSEAARASRDDLLFISTDDVLSDEDLVFYEHRAEAQHVTQDEPYYTTRELVTPDLPVGDYYLIIWADYNLQQREFDDLNNTSAFAFSIVGPVADLTGTGITAPASAPAGGNAHVAWTVTNQGEGAGATDTYYWYDSVYFSTDPVFDWGDTYLGNRFYEPGSLGHVDPGGSYGFDLDVTLPQVADGTYYILVLVDDGNRQGETDEGNNLLGAAIEIRQPVADLFVDSINSRPFAVAGQPFPITFQIGNNGPDNAQALRTDRVYWSVDPFLDASDTPVGFDFRYGHDHAPGTLEYAFQYLYPPADTTPGEYFLIVYVDALQEQAETDEFNNLFTYLITVPEVAPDLTITEVTAPAVAVAGDFIDVGWTVVNQGTGAAPASLMSDSIYLSTDAILDASDIFLGSTYTGNSLPLPVAETYNRLASIQLPSVAAGTYYLIVRADAYVDQSELDEFNNDFATPIELRYRNLLVTDTQAPTEVSADAPVNLSWTVQNDSTEPAPDTFWYDSVYLSTDAVLDFSDTYLGNFFQGSGASLGPGDSYLATLDTFAVAFTGGPHYFLIVIDDGNQVAESDETDNIIALPVEIVAPDLEATSLTAPNEGVLGSTISVQWQVSNVGTVPFESVSYDSFYLSEDDIFDNGDVFLESNEHDTFGDPLQPGENYLASAQVALHSGTINHRYLILVVNNGGVIEVDRANNVYAAPITLTAPDLRGDTISAPANASANQNITVNWSATNISATPANALWPDLVYISTDTVLDPIGDPLLGFKYRQSSPLAPGASYQTSLQVNLSFVTPGNYYILVNVAAQLQPDADRSNNLLWTPITIGVPDLVVTNATAPATGVLGGVVNVSYTVTNEGDTPAGAPSWTDYLYYSDDNVYSPLTDTILATVVVNNGSPLGVGASYTRNQNVTLTRGLPGTRYLFVVSDRFSSQLESNESNNTRAISIELSAPDLTVSAIQAPETLQIGVPANISWTVQNPSAIDAVGNWYDAVYLSNDAVFDISDTFLTLRSRSGLVAGGEYTAQTSVTLPVSATTGAKYLLVRTDRGETQPETDETNNLLAVPIFVGQPDYNLIITSATAPAAIVVGQNFTFSYTVQNTGTDRISTNWTDTLYVSTTPDLAPGSFVAIANYSPNTGAFLDPGASYTREVTMLGPNNLRAFDQYYLVWETDSGRAKLETHENDNRYALPVSVSGADIIVAAIAAPAEAAVGATIEVSWTLTNVGNHATFHLWHDRFSISTVANETGDFVADVPVTTGLPLSPGESHTFTTNLVIPNVLGGSSGGNYYLVINPNVFTEQFETDTSNNVGSVLIHLVPPAADLAVSALSAPADATVGGTIAVGWTVVNNGSADAVTDWVDSVYLSSTPFLDSNSRQVHFETIATQTPLAGGASYSVSTAVTLRPDFPAGAAYILVLTDSGDAQAETNSANNVRAIPINLRAADLEISNLIAPAAGAQGEFIPVSWTVTNVGDQTAFGLWFDGVYLSSDLFVDSSDRLIGGPGGIAPLAAGGSYTQTVNVRVLSDLTGPMYLLVKADRAQGLTETNEDNNVIGQAFQVGGVDLEVTDIVTPTSITLGNSFEVSWTVTNTGDDFATQSFFDVIYLSEDSLIGPSDLQLAVVARTEPVGPGASYTASALVTVPTTLALSAGNYRILVRTDSLVQQAETDEFNNVGSTGNIPLVLPPLPDLIVAAIEPPLEGFSSQFFDLAWTVTNQGTLPAAGPWREQVYLWTTADLENGSAVAIIGEFNVGTGLDAGQSVRRVQRIQFPELTGDYWLVVETDAVNQVGEGPGETNNRRISATALHLQRPPRPDLAITSITPPVDGVFSGQGVTVSFVVTNNGTAPTQVPEWKDSVFLSQSANLTIADLPGGLTAGAPLVKVSNPSYLAPGDSYLQTVTLQLPVNFFGPWYVYAYANSLSILTFNPPNAMVDANPADNLARSTLFNITPLPPTDLRVTSVIAPAQAFSGQSAPLTWTVSNDGESATAVNSWTDRVYLSADLTLDGGDAFVGAFVHDGVLAVGESYTTSGNVSLPIGTSGPFYLLVLTDALHEVYEGDFDGNNVGSDTTATQVILTPPPDLETSLVTVPLVAEASHPVQISYRVTNNGATDTPNSLWDDAIYLSSDDNFDPAVDTLLTTARNFQPLAVGAHYDRTVTAILPDNLAGLFRVFIVADWGQQVFELDRANNVASSFAFSVTSNPADLIVSAIVAPAAVEAGNALQLTYTVTNQGAGATAQSYWTDRIYLSPTPILGSDPVLDTFVHVGSLAPGESYTRTVLLAIPPTAAGTHYVIVRTDVPIPAGTLEPTYLVTGPNGRIFEAAGEANNTATHALAIAGPGADLVVTDVSLPATLFASQTAQIGWTVRNQGSSPTNANFWYDDVYLSKDTQFGNADDVYVGSRLRSSGLVASQEYFDLVDFKIPETVTAGSYHVIVRTDRPVPLNALDTNANRVAEGDEANNTFVSGLVDVVIPPTPDLVITSVTAPESAFSGREIEVSWTVQNQGPAAAQGTWVDVLYLSLDQIFDPGTDQAIAYRTVPGPLGTGNSYNAFATLEIPLGVTGSFYVFVQTDVTKKVFEGTGEANNIAYDPVSLSISLAAPVDLVAGTLTVPATAAPGVETSIVYTVQNNSAFAALGPWTDALYLSTDDVWDVGDLLFGKLKITDDVPAGDSYTRIVTAPMPGINPGDYRVIIRSDILGNIVETNEANNLAASIDQVAVDVPLLELGVAVTGTLNPGQSLFYRVNTAESQTVRVTFDAANGNSHTDIFARKGLLPTSGQYDFTTETPFAADQVLTISQPDKGTYYILIRSTSGTNEATTFSLLAETRPFGIDSIDRSSADRGGTITLQIDGSELFAIYDLEATLDNGAGTSIAASDIFHESPERIFATFDLRGASLGTYSLTLTGSSLEYVATVEGEPFTLVRTDYSDILADCFTVVEARPDDLEYTVYSTPAVRTDRIFDIVVTVANRGTHDVVAPVVTVSTDLDIVLESLVDGVSLTGVISFVAAATQGPGGILRPGQSSVVRLIAHAPNIATTIEVTAGPLTDDGTPVDWDGLIESYGGDPAAEPWSTVKAALIDKYGTTWTSYGLGLAQQATELSAIDGRIATVTALIEDTMFTLMASLSEEPSSPPEPSPLAPTGSSATVPAGAGANLQNNGALLQPTTGGLEALEAWAAIQAQAWENEGLSTAAFHQRAWYLPLGVGGGTPSEKIWEHGSVASKRAEATTYGKVLFSKVHNDYRYVIEAELKDRAKTDRDKTKIDKKPPTLNFLTGGTNGLKLKGDANAYSEHGDIEFAFGDMTGGSGYVDKIDFKDVDECNVHYEGVIHYEWTDDFNYNFGDLGAETSALLEAFGWAKSVHTGLRIEKKVEGVVKKDDDCENPNKRENGNKSKTEVTQPRDPNDIIGPAGFGDEKWTNAKEPLEYMIRFENQASATGPAQQIVITTQLDPDLDYRTFRVGEFGWSGERYAGPANQPFLNQRIDLTEELGFFVDVQAAIDVQTGLATWTLTSIDPATGEVPRDASKGLLPPNIADGIGEGFVRFTVKAKSGLATGTKIDALATIVFDTEPPLDTPIWTNTLDVDGPSSAVQALAPETEDSTFTVRWSGADAASGSGLAGYSIFVSTDGGVYVPWLVNTSLEEAPFAGEEGHTYAFYSIAHDNAGNSEAPPPIADAVTQVAQNLPPAASLAATVLSGTATGALLRFTLDAFDNSASDRAAGFTFTLDWDDGLGPQTVSGPSGVTIERELASGAHVVSLAATDRHGATSEISRNVVFVGTQDDDVLWAISHGTSMSLIGFQFGGPTFVPRTVSDINGMVMMFGLGGDDLLVGDLVRPQRLYLEGDTGADLLVGGENADVLDGGAGDDILIGGGGDDQLRGGADRDILAAGAGADSLSGGLGQDILIAAPTLFDTDAAAVGALLTDWTLAEDYAARVERLSGSPAAPPPAAQYILQPGVTVLDDESIDHLFGDDDADWFLADLGEDLLLDLAADEVALDLGP